MKRQWKHKKTIKVITLNNVFVFVFVLNKGVFFKKKDENPNSIKLELLSSKKIEQIIKSKTTIFLS